MPAGQVGAPGDGALPLRLDRLQQLLVTGLHGHVDRAAGQVEGPYGMPAKHRRPPYGQVVLEVRAPEMDLAEGGRPAALDEAAGHLQMALGAGGPVELHQRHLDLGVPARPGVVHEPAADVVGRPHGHLGELVRAVGAEPGHAGLDEVAVAVELVAPLQVGVAAAAPAGVEVAVALLRPGHRLGQRRQLGVVGPGHRLQQLVDLRVAELAAPARALAAEVADPAFALHPLLAVRDGDLAVERDAVAPEAGRQAYRVEAERGQRARGGQDGVSHAELLT